MALKHKTFSLVIAGLLLFGWVSAAYSWGSKAGFNTHYAIAKKAYELLEADPAFEKDRFPTFPSISQFEGSTNGPDGEGVTEFSEHYYNPKFSYPAGMANGAKSAATKYSLLVSELAKGRYLEAAEPAAWCAHFIADMHVPFHVSGLSKDAVLSLYESHKNDKEPIPLDEKYFISMRLAYKSANHDNNFRSQIENFKDFLKSNARLDWFDPWYYNGYYDYTRVADNLLTTTYVASSSHVLWEGMAGAIRTAPPYDLAGLPAGWQNPAVDINKPKPDSKALDSIYNLAVSAAEETQYNAGDYIQDASLAFNRAAQRIYTAWRASFSALQAVPNVVQKKDYYLISVSVLNKAVETAKDVKVRITVGNESPQVKDYGDAPGGGKPTLKSADFQVKAPKDKTKVKIELTGKFQNTPDLQYAVTEEELSGGSTEGGFEFYEGSVQPLWDAAEAYIMSLASDDLKVEKSDFFDVWKKNDSELDQDTCRGAFSFNRKINKKPDGTFDWKEIGRVWYLELSVTRRAYVSTAKKELGPQVLQEIARKSAEYDEFRLLSDMVENIKYGEYYSRTGTGERAVIVEDNVPDNLLDKNVRETCKNAYNEKTGTWNLTQDVPRKFHGSYHIFYIRVPPSYKGGPRSYRLQAVAANVGITITVDPEAGGQEESWHADPKAILYAILRKIPYSGSEFPVAAPAAEQSAPKITLEEQKPAQAESQPQSQPQPAQGQQQQPQASQAGNTTEADLQKAADDIKKSVDDLGNSLKDLFKF